MAATHKDTSQPSPTAIHISLQQWVQHRKSKWMNTASAKEGAAAEWGWTKLLSSQSSFSLHFSFFSYMLSPLNHHFLFSFILLPGFCLWSQWFLFFSSFLFLHLGLFFSNGHTRISSISFFSFCLSLFQSWALTKHKERPINQPLILRLLCSSEHKHTNVYTKIHTCTLEPSRLVR